MDFDGKVKGAPLLARMRFVRSLAPEASSAILGALEEGDRRFLEGTELRPERWFPAEVLLRLDAAIASALGNGDRSAVLVALGEFLAEACFGPTGALRPLAVARDPHALLREVPRVHPDLHGAGARGYARIGARAALVRASKGHRNQGDDCLTNVGWLRRAVEICGGREVRVTETACVGRGGNCCEYRCEWR